MGPPTSRAHDFPAADIYLYFITLSSKMIARWCAHTRTQHRRRYRHQQLFYSFRLHFNFNAFGISWRWGLYRNRNNNSLMPQRFEISFGENRLTTRRSRIDENAVAKSAPRVKNLNGVFHKFESHRLVIIIMTLSPSPWQMQNVINFFAVAAVRQ